MVCNTPEECHEEEVERMRRNVLEIKFSWSLISRLLRSRRCMVEDSIWMAVEAGFVRASDVR